MPMPLPLELREACTAAALTVLAAPFDHDQAMLLDPMPFLSRGDTFTLLLRETWPPERIEWTTRQALADLGAPGFEDVPVEPFGQLPHQEA